MAQRLLPYVTEGIREHVEDQFIYSPELLQHYLAEITVKHYPALEGNIVSPEGRICLPTIGVCQMLAQVNLLRDLGLEKSKSVVRMPKSIDQRVYDAFQDKFIFPYMTLHGGILRLNTCKKFLDHLLPEEENPQIKGFILDSQDLFGMSNEDAARGIVNGFWAYKLLEFQAKENREREKIQSN